VIGDGDDDRTVLMGDMRVPAIIQYISPRTRPPPSTYAPWIPRGVNVAGDLGTLGGICWAFGGMPSRSLVGLLVVGPCLFSLLLATHHLIFEVEVKHDRGCRTKQ
jgi:hypothetical protein